MGCGWRARATRSVYRIVLTLYLVLSVTVYCATQSRCCVRPLGYALGLPLRVRVCVFIVCTPTHLLNTPPLSRLSPSDQASSEGPFSLAPHPKGSPYGESSACVSRVCGNYVTPGGVEATRAAPLGVTMRPDRDLFGVGLCFSVSQRCPLPSFHSWFGTP